MPLLIKFLHKQHLLDEGGRRKIHKGQIPAMGGIVIFLAFVFSLLAWLPVNDIFSRKHLFSAIILIFLTGFRDDSAPLKPWSKLVAQLVAVLIVVGLADVRIDSFHGFLGIYEIPRWISIVFSVFVIIVVTNAFNLIDGVDGLAASIAVVGFSFYACWFFITNNYEYAIMMFALVGAVLGFLYFNWHKAAIFMGDTGSLILGFLLSISTIAFIKSNGTLAEDVNEYSFKAPIAMAVTIALFPLFDTLRVFILRVRQGKSPFAADKQHLHHYLLRLGYNHEKVTLIITGIFAFIVLVMLLLSRVFDDNILIPVLILFCFALSLYLRKGVLDSYKKQRKEADKAR
jgi:UDP-N-acetylmuramyl pentapeptide phosphotransferase/UDP-N-acetylglucosamine-1-phosphate transferase